MLACLIDSTLKHELNTDFKVDAFFYFIPLTVNLRFIKIPFLCVAW